MPTEKQIKNLKKGDPIVIHTTFDHVDSEGDVRFLIPNSCGDDNYAYIKLKYVSLPGEPAEQTKPKYDPYRPFKKGDIVRYVEKYGRSYVDAPPVGETCRVYGCEDIIGMVNVEFKFSENEEPAVHDVPFYHLELITPVEELEPYYIEEKDIEFQVRMKYEDKDCLISIFRFKNIIEGYKQYCDMLPSMKQAREAAESELNRLNTDYKNKQK